MRAAGVVVPGIYTPRTGRAWAPNLWGKDEVPLLAELVPRLPVPVVVDSDRSGSVLGEQWLGVARDCTDVVFLAVGTGIGAGILSHGRLVRGRGGIAGAVGWFALDPRWREDYGCMGGFEAEAAGPALARRFGAASAEAVADGGPPRRIRALVGRWTRPSSGWPWASPTSSARSTRRSSCSAAASCRPPTSSSSPYGAPCGAGPSLVAAEQCRIETTLLGEDAALFGAARLALLAETP